MPPPSPALVIAATMGEISEVLLRRAAQLRQAVAYQEDPRLDIMVVISVEELAGLVEHYHLPAIARIVHLDHPTPPQRYVIKFIELVADLYRVNVTDIMSPLKTKVVTRARYAVIWGLFRTTELGYAPLGRLVDRDHSTVMSGFRRFATHVEVNPSIGEKLRACEHQARIAMHDAFGE